MIPIAVTLVGVVLLGLAVGFLLAVSIGIRRRDSRGAYRSLRGDDPIALSRTGRLVVGLRFTNEKPAGTAPPQDRASTPV
ncbi:hypothetical protein ABZ234_26955 [Nocardiopsis sp. NPDC006198]|jgi:hypothetical protein|uniref:Uncharacterized protein n=1 Tax=Streptomonospora nanhaiensis TaxID=1323731 RepID=A0ABY6YKL1_9ACTN|nr:hypothetical protein [Streptomonospora nanhaiensis]WAE72768.1 hypothetical protein OUQ99_26885 [Streptomonospora nanhaiensis]